MATQPDENDLIRRRHEKLAALRARGVDPFGGRYPVTHWAGRLAAAPAGPPGAPRHQGKPSFPPLQDYTGTIQLYARADQLGDEYGLFTDLDAGDFVGVTGELFRTRTGELTVAVKSFAFLTKDLRPRPEKWHGLKDVERRYRQRYLDLVVNQESRAVFRLRSRLAKETREAA